jgi:AcrR family transcriptional regulator
MADQDHERLRAHVPKQARSRQTLSRLLDAAEAILREKGYEGATVPAIAGRAGVSVGVVYRRFSDKDDLLRAVYERFFTRLQEANLAALSLPGLARMSLEQLVRGVVTGMVVGYRHHRSILQALTRYARNHHDANFRMHAEQLSMATFPHIVALFLRQRHSMAHPDPEAAIPFALLTVVYILTGALLEEEDWHTSLVPVGGKLEEELTGLVLRYLEVETEAQEGLTGHESRAAAPPKGRQGRRSGGERTHE